MKTWQANAKGALAALALMTAAPAAMAQDAGAVPGDRLVVPLPDVSTLSEEEARDLTRQVAEANVISDNCPAWEATDGEWQLLNGTSDALTARLGLDPLAYDREFFRPAYNLLDESGACETHGPQVASLVERLVAMGGDTRPAAELAEEAAAEGAATDAAADPAAEADAPDAAEPEAPAE
ncbi:hypothetical protein [Paracoccus tibetensis]|uniref:Uncharacterized protein n=1 Tax=Paracoccus tibetensis TaxID=336292 RepID=A0A1G5ER67_9RHOB|nr:hypothetical protein [Paracoccus tibetensis]SCY28918.1 hypothetical protein SAMN05660710_01178 [Paracoccus tibetensis]